MNERYFTYILYSIKLDKFYYGFTSDLSKRLDHHNAGRVKSTKAYLPWTLAWYQIFNNRSAAMERERKLKNLKSRKRVSLYVKANGLITNGSSDFFL